MNISMVPTPVIVGSVEREVPWPAILLSDWLKTIFERTDGSVLLQHPAINVDEWTQELALFWSRYKAVDPGHPVMRLPAQELAYCVPLAYHGDEGRGRQKRPVLVTSMQPLLARKGHSFMSRFLLTLVPSERYSGERSLRALHDSLSADLANLFHQGFEAARPVASLMFRANCGASFS